MPRSPIENIINRFVLETSGDIMATMRNALGEFATSRTSKQLIRFVQLTQHGPGAAEAAATHHRLGVMMKQSTVASYEATKKKYGRIRYPIDRKQRSVHGALEKALDTDKIFLADAEGVSFVDTKRLNKDVQHWYRVNFGAEPEGTPVTETFPVRFSNISGSFVFTAQPDKPFGIPKGLFTPGAAGSAFYLHKEALANGLTGIPVGAKLPKGFLQETKGFDGRHFIEAGIRRFFKELPGEYSRMFRRTLPSSERVGRPPSFGEIKTVRSRRR